MPFNWRGWWDFGTGALGDMGCHILDAVVLGARPAAPDRASRPSGGEPRKPETSPSWAIIRYEFPARGDMPALNLTWYDGGKLPPEELFEGHGPARRAACCSIGDKGKIYVPHDYGGKHGCSRRISSPTTRPPSRPCPDRPATTRTGSRPARTASRPACSDFSYSGPLTEMVLLGVVAFRCGKRIEWDGPEHQGHQLLRGRRVHPSPVPQGLGTLIGARRRS